MAIEGKVAAILNERDLVINRGSDSGVHEGMRFGVVEKDVPIVDPDTGETLGHLDREKIRVKIVEAHPKFSIGKTYETYMINEGGAFPNLAITFSHFMMQRREVTRVRTLRTNDASFVDPLGERSAFVKVGDTVVQVEEEAKVND